jgi:putative transposase
MNIKRLSHAVYDTRYHLVWAPKYRKWVLRDQVREMVRTLKSVSAKEIFRRYPEVKRELWGGEFWEDGYFVRTVGDKVTSEMIKQYFQYHRHEQKTPKQLSFDS